MTSQRLNRNDEQDLSKGPLVSTPTRLVLRRLRRSHGALIGAGILLALLISTAIAPILSPYDPIKMAPGESLQGPSSKHLMGTDDFGRDILTRVLYGARISLLIGLIAVGIGGIIGTIIGILAGYYGGRLDMGVSRVIEIMMAFPGILLALVIMTLLGPSLTNVMIAVGISDIPLYVRLVRGCVLSVREREYVEAARALGCSHSFIMFRHILPNCVAPIIVLATLAIGWAIVQTAGLSFLGLGAQPPLPEWGAMLAGGRNYMLSAWWIATFPGLAIVLTVVGFNLLGDGLRDVLDPYLRGR